MASEAMNRGANPRAEANLYISTTMCIQIVLFDAYLHIGYADVALSFNSRTKGFEPLNGGAIPPDAAKGSDDLCDGGTVRYCHSARSHPEVPMHAIDNFGSIHRWEKRQIHKAIRRYYKNGKWLRGAIADAGSLNLSQLRVQLPS